MIFCSEFCKSLVCRMLHAPLLECTHHERHPWQLNPFRFGIVLVRLLLFFCCLFYAKQPPAPSSSMCYSLSSVYWSERIPSYFSNAHKYFAVSSSTEVCFGFTLVLVLAMIHPPPPLHVFQAKPFTLGFSEKWDIVCICVSVLLKVATAAISCAQWLRKCESFLRQILHFIKCWTHSMCVCVAVCVWVRCTRTSIILLLTTQRSDVAINSRLHAVRMVDARANGKIANSEKKKKRKRERATTLSHIHD